MELFGEKEINSCLCYNILGERVGWASNQYTVPIASKELVVDSYNKEDMMDGLIIR
jgi:hypothetical protein